MATILAWRAGISVRFVLVTAFLVGACGPGPDGEVEQGIDSETADLRSGKGGGRGAKLAPGILSVSPNPVPIGSQSVQINGTGFAPNEYLGVGVFGVCCYIPATADASGAFSVPFFRNWDWPGTYTVEAYGTRDLRGTTTFTVE